MSYLKGIDVSRWQGVIDWKSVAAAGVKFAFIKATEGISVVDNRFAANWVDAKSAGVVRGAYHYFHPNLDPVFQAQFFCKTVNRETYDMPLALDIETGGGLSSTELAKSIYTCLSEIKRISTVTPIIYTGYGFWSGIRPSPEWSGSFDLWVANYTTASQPKLPPGWMRWIFWQYTSEGRIPGISGNVDCNWFNGSFEDLTAWVRQMANKTPDEWSITIRTSDKTAWDFAVKYAKEIGLDQMIVEQLSQVIFRKSPDVEIVPPPQKEWWELLKLGEDAGSDRLIAIKNPVTLYKGPRPGITKTMTVTWPMNVYEIAPGGWLRVTKNDLWVLSGDVKKKE